MPNISEEQKKSKPFNETPSFSYTIGIPSALLEDDALSNSQKILLINLIGLSHQEGYCWASDKYLMEKLGVSLSTLKRELRQLEELHYIRRYSYKEGMIQKRKIYVTNAFSKKVCGVSPMTPPGGHPRPSEGVTSDPHNNISINNRKISKEIQSEPRKVSKSVADAPSLPKISFGEFKRVKLSSEDYEDLCERLGKDHLEEIIDNLDAWLEENGKVKKNYKATILNWARREKQFNPSSAKEDLVTKHKEEALKLRTLLFSKAIPQTFQMNCFGHWVELGHSEHPHKEIINYEEKGFQRLLEHKLRKMNVFQYLT